MAAVTRFPAVARALNGQVVVVTLDRCWRNVNTDHDGYTACGVRHDNPEGIGLCSQHLTELRRLP